MLRDYLEQTHSAAFELRRHFFLRFFESELISDASQTKVVAGGACGILVSLSLIFGQAYFHKYRMLQALDSPEPYRLAVLADVLFLVTLVMFVSALFTVLEWPALFPGLRDYLALASLPVSMREIFMAKFTALLAIVMVVVAAAALPPSMIVPAMMAGPYSAGVVWHVLGIFVGGSLAGLFVFFSLVALQGVLLNLLPIRLFPRISLALQGLLLGILLVCLPLVFSIPSLYNRMDTLPQWTAYAPPLWFFGIDQSIVRSIAQNQFAHRTSYATHLAGRAILALISSMAAAILTYLWSYRRHRIRVLESPSVESAAAGVYWPDRLSDLLLPGTRSLGVFGFIAKSLARSPQHRLILIAFAGIAVAVISEGFAGIVLSGGAFRPISASTEGVRESIIAIPLAISMFLIGGFRYLFRLPVELRANWLFRITEPGHTVELLAGVERFLFYWGAVPVAVVTLPIEMSLLGARAGIATTVSCFLISLLLIEVVLFTFAKVPFTSSYFPGRRPLIETVLKYSTASALYIWGCAGLVSLAERNRASTTTLLIVLAAGRWWLRRARLTSRQFSRMEFEEGQEAAVQVLGIERE